MSKQHGAIFLFTAVLFVFTLYVLIRYEPHTFNKFDPFWQTLAVQSMWEDGDLDLRNQLNNDPGLTAAQVALGERGEWYPSHEFLIVLPTVPSFALLGLNGCLVFNVLSAALLALLSYLVAVRHSSPEASFVSAFLMAVSSPLLSLSYNYSNDVFGALVLVWAFLLCVSGRWSGAGAAFGCAVMARSCNVTALPAFIVFIALAGKCPKRLARKNLLRNPLLHFLLGGLPFACWFFAANRHMYGGPLEFGYERLLRFDFINWTLQQTSTSQFYSRPVLSGLPEVLFDRAYGFFFNGALALPAFCLGLRDYIRRARHEVVFSAVLALGLFALISKLERYVPFGGPRYFLAVYALLVPYLAFSLEMLVAWAERSVFARIRLVK